MTQPASSFDVPRAEGRRRPAALRIGDYAPVGEPMSTPHATAQASRCMGCGVPFCHDRCPLHNVIPEWNDLVVRGDWRRAYERLDATNNFPEFTGRLCPAPCESACVLALGGEAVTIEEIELAIVEEAFKSGWVAPQAPSRRTGRAVAVVGSGPAGLAAAQQLNRSGHAVTVYERAERLGGLLRFGIPDYKMDKALIDRRTEVLALEGVRFRTGCDVGADLGVADLGADAIVLAIGASRARELAVEGAHLDGVHPAMRYLVQQNRRVAGLEVHGAEVSARDRDVVIIGGGDTASDCLGNALREQARSVTELSWHADPDGSAPAHDRWPEPPLFAHSVAREEGGTRRWSSVVRAFRGTTSLEAVELTHVDVVGTGPLRRIVAQPGPPVVVVAQLALLAVGFEGVEHQRLLDALGLQTDDRGTIADAPPHDAVPAVFSAGDAATGAALVVNAIDQGRRAAHRCDQHLRALLAESDRDVA